MTEGQIRYWNLKENQRHNRATEEETNRSNLATEGIKRDTNIETKRSNLANESIKQATLNETVRSNQAKEYETHRSNVAKETETSRSNLAKESENFRHNFQTEMTDVQNATTRAAGQVTDELRLKLDTAVAEFRNTLDMLKYETGIDVEAAKLLSQNLSSILKTLSILGISN